MKQAMILLLILTTMATATILSIQAATVATQVITKQHTILSSIK